jgi:hypothetical protein
MQTALPEIKGIRIGTVEVTYKGKLDPETYFWGTVSVKCGDREFIWDVCESYTDDLANGHYMSTLDLCVDLDFFADCKYNLTREDLLDPDSATLDFDGIDTSKFKPIIELWFTDLEADNDDEYERGHYTNIQLLPEY